VFWKYTDLSMHVTSYSQNSNMSTRTQSISTSLRNSSTTTVPSIHRSSSVFIVSFVLCVGTSITKLLLQFVVSQVQDDSFVRSRTLHFMIPHHIVHVPFLDSILFAVSVLPPLKASWIFMWAKTFSSPWFSRKFSKLTPPNLNNL